MVSKRYITPRKYCSHTPESSCSLMNRTNKPPWYRKLDSFITLFFQEMGSLQEEFFIRKPRSSFLHKKKFLSSHCLKFVKFSTGERPFSRLFFICLHIIYIIFENKKIRFQICNLNGTICISDVKLSSITREKSLTL